MTPAPVPLTRDLVLIGGGHAHALVLRRWGMAKVPGARLTLVNPGPTAPYTGMLPGFVAGHYSRDALEIDLVRLARFAGARLILGKANAIDRKRRRIRIEGRGEIAYDIASIDVGITSDMPGLPGFGAHGVAAKPLQRFADRWSAFLTGEGPAEVAIIGGGVAGVELAMAMTHALRTKGRSAAITVIEADHALSGLVHATQQKLLGAMSDMGIALVEGAQAAEVAVDHVVLEDGRSVPAQLTVGAAGARPWPWLAEIGLDETNGFLDVDETLRTSDPAIYAAGDCVHMGFAPRPKAGVYAVRAAQSLAHNLRADLTGGPQRRFAPQRDFLKLISLGDRGAVAERSGLTVAGDWVWRWKDRIDRRFMDKLADLPRVPRPPLPRRVARGVDAEIAGGKVLCGGCGSKVGPETLSGALERVALPERSDVERLPGDDAAVLLVGDAQQVISTDHLRAFTEDPYLMGRIAALHATGDIWAMGATPQAALATIILPRMTSTMQADWLEEIMAGAAAALGSSGAAIAGGHSSVGSELTVGFTVTGVLEQQPITRSGAQPGDALVLTRPIGSGTILAAEMALDAPGPVVAAALRIMAEPQIAAADLLRGAHAMTDVTGFGLAGHLLGICNASGVGAELMLNAIPVYEGAEALVAKGIRSTIFSSNKAATESQMTLPDTPTAPLLFDPQTAGGLLAALPEADAEAVVARLRDAGIGAARIGTIQNHVPHITVRQ